MSIRAWLFGPASILLALAVVAGAFVVFGSTDTPVEAADHRDSITPQTDPFAGRQRRIRIRWIEAVLQPLIA